MRPVKLVMSAFGPYADTVEVDFERLGSEGIYLLCGDTGAGKTTVFDAISFALFGKASGADRDVRGMRSDFAAPDTPTYVELWFSYAGAEYRVRRNPEYERPAKRGGGMTTQVADAELEEPGKPLVTKVRQVDERIREILGIDREQFAQIVMIAQGDFRRLLSASTKERSEILRRVFGTQPYVRFQEELERQCGEVRDQARALREQVRTLAGTAALAEGDPRAERLASWAEDDALTAGGVADLLESALAEDRAAAEELDARKRALEDREAELNRLLERASTEAELVARRSEATAGLADLEAQEPAVRRALEDARAAAGQAPELEVQAALAHRDVERFCELEEARSLSERAREKAVAADEERGARDENVAACRERALAERERADALAGADGVLAAACERLAQAERGVADAQAAAERAVEARRAGEARAACADARERAALSLDEARALADDARRACDAARAAANELNGAPAEQAAAQAGLERASSRLEQARTDRDRVAELAARADKAAGELGRLEVAYGEACDAKQAAAHDYDVVYRAFLDAQAGLLARSMAVGEPCPVCGSTEHPAPAACPDEAPSQEDVEDAERRRADAEKAMAQASSEVARARGTLGACREEQAAFAAQHGDAGEVERLVADLEREVAAAGARFAAAAESAVELERRTACVRELEERHMDARSAVERLSDELAAVERDLSAATARAEMAERALGGATEETSGRDLEQARRVLDDARRAEESARRDVAAREEALQQAVDAENACAEAQARRAEADDRARAAHLEASAAEARAASLAEGLAGYAGRDDAQRACDELNARAMSLRAAFDEAADAARVHEGRLAACRASLAELERQLASLPAGENRDVEGVSAQIGEVVADRRDVEGRLSAVRSRIQANESAVRALRRNEEEHGDADRRFGELDVLYRTASGKLAGRDRVSFETHLQAIYFDRVLAAANARLAVMTGGRYELVRRTRATGGNAQTGLDLDVFDGYTGRARDASTLSGGESFKASLSLALGLSDVTQAYAGGIRLDTMFVDEGFGSLDQESLQLAVRTLTELAGSGKLVGIISHVEELKESIDRKVVVEHGPCGSTLRIEA